MMRKPFQNFARICSAGLITAGLLLLAASCSSNQQKKSGKTAPASPAHDPYSAPLTAATEKTKAPDFKTKLLDGTKFHLADQRGKVVLINIWATWCPPCKEETPELVDLYNKYQSRGLEFLGVSVDKQGKSVVKPFVKKYDVSYPITIDDGTIMEKYGPVMGYPTSYLIGRDGRLRYFVTGALTKKELQPRLKKLLAEKAGE